MSVKCKHGNPVYQGCVDCPPDPAPTLSGKYWDDQGQPVYRVVAIALSEYPICSQCERTSLQAAADELFYRVENEEQTIICSFCMDTDGYYRDRI